MGDARRLQVAVVGAGDEQVSDQQLLKRWAGHVDPLAGEGKLIPEPAERHMAKSRTGS